jgi:AAA+ superfamily predicted ATPase
LISFLESTKSLDDVYGLDAVKAWVRQDIALWLAGDTESVPMGYLLCGPVGTGKTFLVECIAGEAKVPVVKINNFRDKWMGTTEGNLEKIFRLLAALGKCFVFVDEADQSLGKRDSGADDGGLSGRIYSMFAQEMSNSANRGRILWILATSRPDLVEVDLKRPGRVDVKIPIFPTTTPEEGFSLIQNLSKRSGVEIPDEIYKSVEKLIPELLTPGAANTLAVALRRATKTEPAASVAALLERILSTYQAPVSREVMDFQIGLAAAEASDLNFVPPVFRSKKRPS